MLSWAWPVAAAFLLDLAFGDPRWLPHPVRAMGWLAARLEEPLRRSGLPLRLAGILMVLLVVGLSTAVAFVLVAGAGMIHPLAGAVVSTLLLYTTMATRDLGDHALAVARPLGAGDVEGARRRVSWMVGRDTAALDEAGIALAATESVAENTVDGVTAPLFWGLLLGPVGAIAFKAASTLDSTFGYRNERYREFGWASARFDDLLNLVPARLSVAIIALAAALGKLRVIAIFKAVRRGARLHASPNAGFPEAAFAGALGVTFGGMRSYGGVPHQAVRLGIEDGACTSGTILDAVALMRSTAVIFLGAGLLLLSLFDLLYSNLNHPLP